MDAHLALIPEEEDKPYGTVKPMAVIDGSIRYGLSVGSWSISNGITHVILSDDIDTIVHETATRKAVNAEIRAAEKDARGIDKPVTVEYNPVTKRFRQIEG